MSAHIVQYEFKSGVVSIKAKRHIAYSKFNFCESKFKICVKIKNFNKGHNNSESFPRSFPEAIRNLMTQKVYIHAFVEVFKRKANS